MIPIAASAALSAAGSLASILGATASSSSGSAAANAGSSTTTAKGDNVTQADFMQLLVAQLQNQDPLNPLDSADFAAQLAQFSSLQQLTEINTSLKSATGVNGAGGSSGLDAVGFLGKQVEGASDAVEITQGTGTTLGYTLSGTGDVHVRILDANGNTVAPDLDLGTQTAGAHTLDLGKLPNAPKLADGTYTVMLASVDGGGTASAVSTVGGGTVTGLDLSGKTPTLIIGSRRIALTDVTQVQQPAGS